MFCQRCRFSAGPFLPCTIIVSQMRHCVRFFVMTRGPCTISVLSGPCRVRKWAIIVHDRVHAGQKMYMAARAPYGIVHGRGACGTKSYMAGPNTRQVRTRCRSEGGGLEAAARGCMRRGYVCKTGAVSIGELGPLFIVDPRPIGRLVFLLAANLRLANRPFVWSG